MNQEVEIHIFKLLLALLQAKSTTEAVVRQRLEPLAQITRSPSARLEHTYLTLKGSFFELTATFTSATQQLKQVSLWVTSPAFKEMRTLARALPPRGNLLGKTVLAYWQKQWGGFFGHLLLRPAKGNASDVSARFIGMMPGKKLIVLTRR